MARIKIEARKLSLVEKCQRGRTVIARSTDNPAVPGNGGALEKFAAANETLERVRAEIAALQTELAMKFSEQEAAARKWNDTLIWLSDVTETSRAAKLRPS